MEHARLRIDGMTCANCRDRIERSLRKAPGVKSAAVSYGAGTADIDYDAGTISLQTITAAIEKLGYQVLAGNENRKAKVIRAVALLAVIAVLYFLLQYFGVLNRLVPSQLAGTEMGYGMLFVVGLLTSVHCIAMCGGINLSQCVPRGGKPAGQGRFAAFKPAFLYNLGRVISYTAIGGVLGLVGLLLGGSAGAGLPVTVQGILKILAGIFMVIMGINMLGIFPWLRKWQPPKFFSGRAGGGPFVVGLLGGLMPCGPLQAMQLVALASGNPFAGALSMLLFSLGTVPLMLGLGSVVAALGVKFAKKVMAAGAVLVVVLGLAMLSQGASLSRFTPAPDDGVSTIEGQQIIESTLGPGRYPDITVRAGIPVKWTIHAPEGSINGCHNRMLIPAYGIEYAFKPGGNTIEFIPGEPGRFQYSCWMGMIRGTITVVNP
ncbi:MAG: sulfite exporter TauE/SafE family protein [Oscillospiraceae bacterium]|jgi:sulfite exporter TauE/SafE/copper chaperone CopZ|nr:sulfite exporter TauE/SafE family protein [Oscillospiraceae bacterium]